MVDWDKRFLELSKEIASWSKDKSVGVGAIVADYQHRIISVGYNGFPRGANDEIPERYERPQKYDYTEHAERNALYSASYLGASTNGATIYCTLFPCADCARGIIQSGITRVVTYEIDKESSTWANSWSVANELFGECGISVTYLKKTKPHMPYSLGDKVLYPGVDQAPFIVKGIKEDELLLEGDWSGGTHDVCQTGWAPINELKPYKE